MCKRTYKVIYYMSWTARCYQSFRWRLGVAVGSLF